MLDRGFMYWDEIFKNRTKNKASRENKGSLCIYWYLLNKIDCPSNIQEEFKRYNIDNDFPKGLEDNHHFNESGWGLLKDRFLIEKDHEENGEHSKKQYYKVNAEFLCLPYYAGTVNGVRYPHSSYVDPLTNQEVKVCELAYVWNSLDRYTLIPIKEWTVYSKEEIETYYKSIYKKQIDWQKESEVVESVFEDARKYEAFRDYFLGYREEDTRKIIKDTCELLNFVHDVSREPKEFLKPLAKLKKLNYISLWMLIQRMFYELFLYLSLINQPIPPVKDANTLPVSYKDAKKVHDYFVKCRKNSKEILEKEAILDLKKISNMPEEESRYLYCLARDAYRYLGFLIKVYFYYENGTLEGNPFYTHGHLKLPMPMKEIKAADYFVNVVLNDSQVIRRIAELRKRDMDKRYKK